MNDPVLILMIIGAVAILWITFGLLALARDLADNGYDDVFMTWDLNDPIPAWQIVFLFAVLGATFWIPAIRAEREDDCDGLQ